MPRSVCWAHEKQPEEALKGTQSSPLEWGTLKPMQLPYSCWSMEVRLAPAKQVLGEDQQTRPVHVTKQDRYSSEKWGTLPSTAARSRLCSARA